MTSFIAELKRRLPEADWPLVVAALRNGAQLWADLQDRAFGAQALEAAAGQRENWSPAFLGLLRLGHAEQFESLRGAPMAAVSEKLRYQAASAYELLAAEGVPADQTQPDLVQATLLALALRERRRLLNSWEQLPNDLTIAPAEFWKPAIACLFGLMPNPQELLVTLLAASQASDLHELGLHALVSNPLPLDQQSAHLQEIISSYELPQFLELLRKVASVSTPLSQQAALQALEDLQSDSSDEGELAQIQRALLQAEIYQISGKTEQAQPMLNKAWEAAQSFQSQLAATLAETANENGDVASSLAILKKSGELIDPKKLIASVGSSATGKQPSALISAARIAIKNQDQDEAVKMAKGALLAAQKNSANLGSDAAGWLRKLSQLFFDLRLFVEALVAAEMALTSNPNDAEGAALLSDALNINNESAKALEAAHLAAALAPERNDYRRSLAKALQASGDAQGAMTEWQALVDREVSPSVEDLTALAETALANGDTQTTIEACQQALALQVTNGHAHALLGKALIEAGDEISALEHLQRATELAPAQPGAWLALAKLQQATSDSQAALATLLNAQQYSAPSAKLQAILAETYLGLEQHQDALAAFKRAAQLATEHADGKLAQQIALHLGKLQAELGHTAEARKTLEIAQQANPTDANIAKLLGKLLVEAGEAKRALPSLLIAQHTEPENIEILMNVARARLAIGDEPAQAAKILAKVLAGKDAPADASGLLAEALAAQGNHGEASKQFETALKTGLGEDATWRKRLTLGKALAQAASGRHTAAIATLEEMDKTQPGDLDILRGLCAAYQKSGRADEALQIAQKVYLETPKDEASALWYSEQAKALGKHDEARKVLSKTLNADSSAKLIQQLAELQWQADSKTPAVETLSILLKKSDKVAITTAGEFLLGNNAAKDSAAFFKRAIEIAGDGSVGDYQNLAQAETQSGQLSEALATLEKIIGLAANNGEALAQKANILQQLGRPQAALEAIENALTTGVNDASLQLQKARILYASQDWAAALESAEKAFGLDLNNSEVLQFATELAVVCLQPERARALFDKFTSEVTGLELSALQAELALEANEELQAAKALVPALESNEEHPRVLALQSRLASRHGDMGQAELNFKKAVQTMQAEYSALTVISMARAAIRLNDWDGAIKLLQDLVKRLPTQALAQLTLGKALLQRAEWQQLNQTAEAVYDAAAFGKEIYAACKQAFANAANAAPFASAQLLIERWQARADLRLGGKVDFKSLPNGYPSNAGEAAALFFAARIGGDAKTAEELSKPYLKTPEVLIERAVSMLDWDTDEAFKLIEQAADLIPTRAQVHAIAARIAQQLGAADRALEYISNALLLTPKQARWHAVAADLHRKLGGLVEAVEHFKEAVSLEPGEADSHFSLGQALIAIQAFGEAIQAFQEAAKQQPQEAKYQLALAEAFRLAGDLKQAGQRASEAHRIDNGRPDALLLQAELALQAEDAQQARTLVEQALKLAPKNPDAQRIFAECLQALGLHDDALAVLERAQEFAEDKLPFLLRRAQMLAQSEAIEQLAKLSQKFPDRAEAFFALSEVLAAAGNFKDAIKAAQQAVKQATQALPRDMQARLHLHLGQLLKHSGQLDQSLHHLDEAAKMAPYLIDAHVERGRVFQSRRQFKQALDAFDKAAAIAPDKAQPHVEAALALKEAKDYGAAEAELRKAAMLAPKDRVVQRQLAALIALNLVHEPQDAFLGRQAA
ncbi:MAG: tetratricopeptide repeat protein [Anaerolineales bacterium]